MVLFTFGSLPTWGKSSRHLAWCLHQVLVCHLPLINYIPLCFTDITLWESMPFSCKKQTSGGKDMALMWGASTFPLGCTGFNFPVTPRHNCPPWAALRFGGRDKNLTTTSLSCWYVQRRKLQETEIMAYQPYGWTLVMPGSPPGGSSWETDHLGLQWTQLALCLSAAAWGHLPWPLLQEGHLGILPQRGWRQFPVGKSANWRSANSLSPAPKSSTI